MLRGITNYVKQAARPLAASIKSIMISFSIRVRAALIEINRRLVRENYSARERIYQLQTGVRNSADTQM